MQLEKKKHDERDDNLIADLRPDERSWLLEAYKNRVRREEDIRWAMEPLTIRRHEYLVARLRPLSGTWPIANLPRGLKTEERAQLNKLESQLQQLPLNEYERLQLRQLEADRDFAQNLADYKEGLNAKLFGELPTTGYPVLLDFKDPNRIADVLSYAVPFTALKNVLGKWNLPTLIEKYDESRPDAKVSTSQRKQYARRALDALEQSKDDFFQNHDWNEYYFNGEKVPEHQTESKFKKARREAVAQAWDSLSELFALHVQPDLEVQYNNFEAQKTTRKQSVAKLLPNVKSTDVRKLFDDIGMGTRHNASGEWAAAIQAIVLAGVLKGTDHEVARWAVDEKYIEQKKAQTIRKACGRNGPDSAEDYTNDAARRIFQAILIGARKLL